METKYIISVEVRLNRYCAYTIHIIVYLFILGLALVVTTTVFDRIFMSFIAIILMIRI